MQIGSILLQFEKLWHPIVNKQIPVSTNDNISLNSLTINPDHPGQAPMDIPNSSVGGIFWPALPHPTNTPVFSLLYQMDQSQWWSPEERLVLQLRQLSVLLNHCLNHIPFYRSRLEGIFEPAQDLTLVTFQRIPLMSRKDIQEFGEQLVCPIVPQSHLPRGKGRTSGSTGRSIEFEYTRITSLFYRALNLRFHLWHKWNFTGKLAAIRMPRTRENNGKTGSARAWMSTYKSGPFVELSAQTPIPEQVEWLEQERPAYLLTYPSNLLALAKFYQQTAAEPPGLRGIDTTGEAVSNELRHLCESVWGMQPKDIYSCMENGILALQCPEYATYHVQSDSVIVEVLNDDNLPCRPGEIGKVVVTDLHNFAMPFIRYEIGDYAEVGAACPCGRTLPTLNKILGRRRNMLILPSGDKLWPILPISEWSQLGPISQLQVLQNSIEEIEVRVVNSSLFSTAQKITLQSSVSEFFDNLFRIKLTMCEEIERSPSGKFEDFKSLVR